MDRRPLKVGFILPSTALPPAGPAIRWAEMVAMARRAEELGFDSIWTIDALVWRSDDDPPLGFWECWTLLSAVAATTSRVQIGSFASCIGYRNPALLAKMAATVDEISHMTADQAVAFALSA